VWDVCHFGWEPTLCGTVALAGPGLARDRPTPPPHNEDRRSRLLHLNVDRLWPWLVRHVWKWAASGYCPSLRRQITFFSGTGNRPWTFSGRRQHGSAVRAASHGWPSTSHWDGPVARGRPSKSKEEWGYPALTWPGGPAVRALSVFRVDLEP